MSKDGATGQMAVWAIVVTIVLAGFGGVYSIAQSVAEVNRKLDRNCVYLKDLSIGLRLHALNTARALDAAEPPHKAEFPFFPNVTC